ncbi:MAG TPA: ATP synthase F1 subunit epsilon [Candidatus Sulfotelmatobacter sp.]|nr:ATP synthase F1 subunit epsilon [Candidatus Sulfotelmatobacter sp.]
MTKLFLHVLTPTKELLKEEVDEIILTTENGAISILPNHASLFTRILPGEMTIKKGAKNELFAIMGGFLEINNNQVNILAEHAIHAHDIEISKVEEAKQRAEKAMKDKDREKEFEELQTEIRRTVLELKVAKKHKSSRT